MCGSRVAGVVCGVAQASPTTNVLSYVFSLLIHLIILGSVVIAAIYLVWLTFWGYGRQGTQAVRPFEEPSSDFDPEIVIRIFSLVGAALLVFLAKATRLSIPDLLGQSLSVTNHIRFTVVGVLGPAAIGMLAAWYFLAAIRKRDAKALRVLIFIGALMVFEFSDVYAEAVQASGFGPTGSLAPNISFLLAISIYCVTRYPGRASVPR